MAAITARFRGRPAAATVDKADLPQVGLEC